MKQPVSRNSFDQRRGYLGVYLQEGAPFVDASWNEAIDVQSSLLRGAIADSGLEGTAGIELRVEPETDLDGRLVNLKLRGGPRRFYCASLPILWPEDQLLFPNDPRCMTRKQSDDMQRWLQKDQFGVYLKAWVETEDVLDRPDLDDPGIGLERGSFRKIVRSCVSLDAPDLATPAPTNLLLTVQGSYVADLNALYRVEPIELTTSDQVTYASILWDPANAAVVAQVTDKAEQAATTVRLSNTAGFELNDYVRFEGPGIRGDLYQVTNCDSNTITIEGHDCHQAPISLEKYYAASPADSDGDVIKLDILDDLSSTGVSAILKVGARVNKLPANLNATGTPCTWLVTAVSPSNSLAGLKMQVQPGPHQKLLLTLAKSDLGSINLGSIVRDLPKPYYQGAWQVTDRNDAGESTVITATPCGSVTTQVQLAPNGLVEELNPWHDDRAALLKVGAHSFDVCLEVEERTDWFAGMRIRIRADSETSPSANPEVVATQSCSECAPGNDRVSSFEDRTIAKIIHHGADDSMTVRLDQALTFDHCAGDIVVPMRMIKARRYRGHECSVEIDRLDPSVCPDSVEHYGPYSLEGGVALENGLMIRLSVESSLEDKDVEPSLIPGDAWTFAARCGGWVETRVFAPVERVPRGCVQLAKRGGPGSTPVIDARPVPAAHAQRPWLDMIRASMEDIAPYLTTEPTTLTDQFSALAGANRAQVGLLGAINGLQQSLSAAFSQDARCKGPLTQLSAAINAVPSNASTLECPRAIDLACIAVALERLAFAASFLEPKPGGAGSGDAEPLNDTGNGGDQSSGNTAPALLTEATGTDKALSCDATERPSIAPSQFDAAHKDETSVRNATDQPLDVPSKPLAPRRVERQFYPLKLPIRFIRPLRPWVWRANRQVQFSELQKQVSPCPPREDVTPAGDRGVVCNVTTRDDSALASRVDSTLLGVDERAPWRSRQPIEQLRWAFRIQDVVAYYNRRARSMKEGR